MGRKRYFLEADQIFGNMEKAKVLEACVKTIHPKCRSLL
jgi:hypothetical protein